MSRSASIFPLYPAVETRIEDQILLCCSRTQMNATDVEQLKSLLQKEIDWEYLQQTAIQHGVMPLLYWNFSTVCPTSVPDFTLASLKTSFEANIGSNLCLTGELIELLKLFASHNIRVIPFKGPVLAASVYGNLALRQFGDLDILIDRQDLAKAKALLLSQGYHSIDELLWENHFVHQYTKTNVDLHWAITPRYFPFQINFEDLWQRTESIALANEKVITLSPEDLLVILCMQVTKDAWEKHEQLIKIHDIAQLVRTHQTLNWQKAIDQINDSSLNRVLFLGLSLANKLFNTPLPEDIKQRIETDPVVKLYAAQIYKQIFFKTNSWNKLKDPVVIFLERLMIEVSPDAVPHKGYLFWQFIHIAIRPTEEDRKVISFPKSVEFLYYLVRPIRLVKKHGLRVLNQLIRFSE